MSQELNVKLSRITKQLEALQAALNGSGARHEIAQSTASNSQDTQHENDDDKDDETEAERVQRFGKSD